MPPRLDMIECKWVPGYEGLYKVDILGNIWSYCRVKVKKLKQGGSKGYKVVSLTKSGVPHTYNVHTLVLTTFVGPCPDGLECRHLDSNRGNNRLSNLEWGTRKQNINDQIVLGTFARGDKNGMAKISNEDIVEVRKMRRLGFTQAHIARKFSVNKSTISKIDSGKLRK